MTTASFGNVYDDAERAAAYATLDFPGTYYLAFRDLPAIIAEHVTGNTALDFGCGAGRSTRFLKQLGFDTIGIDVSSAMIEQALKLDPAGKYLRVDDPDFRVLEPGSFDLILAAFPFDNIPGVAHRAALLRGLKRLLADEGRIIIVGARPEIYVHDWASFRTTEFPENRSARSGDPVRVVMKDVADSRPVTDSIWFHEDYLGLFASAGLQLVDQRMPLARQDEPFDWVTEIAVAPWVIYVLQAE